MDIKEIESAIAQLPPSEVAKLSEWLEEFQAKQWDKHLEQDMQAGRLNVLLEQAEQDFDNGDVSRCEAFCLTTVLEVL